MNNEMNEIRETIRTRNEAEFAEILAAIREGRDDSYVAYSDEGASIYHYRKAKTAQYDGTDYDTFAVIHVNYSKGRTFGEWAPIKSTTEPGEDEMLAFESAMESRLLGLDVPASRVAYVSGVFHLVNDA